MPNRTDCEVYLNDTIDVTELMQYIEKKNTEYKMTLFHCAVTGLARMIKERPMMNRFPQKYIADSTAMIKATNGVPRNFNAGRIRSIPGIYSETVLHKIKTNGTRIIHSTAENAGRLPPSASRTS